MQTLGKSDNKDQILFSKIVLIALAWLDNLVPDLLDLLVDFPTRNPSNRHDRSSVKAVMVTQEAIKPTSFMHGSCRVALVKGMLF